MKSQVFMRALALMAVLGLSVQPALADPEVGHGKMEGYSKESGHGKGYGHEQGYGKGHGGGYGSHGGHRSMAHGSTGHFIRSLLTYAKGFGLTDEQVAKLKAIQLDLDKTRIKTEADIMIAERELRALLDDEKSDLSAIEAKVKQSEELEVGLRMAAIKAKRDAKAVLTPEQRDKLKAVHERMKLYGKRDGREAEAERESEDKEKVRFAGKAKVSLEEAVKTAGQKVAGKVVEAELEEEDGKLLWEVEIVTGDGNLQKLHVDAHDGKLVEVKD
ncbi:PepSY domain-containing protein [Nitrospira sp. Kam-Ns4a]